MNIHTLKIRKQYADDILNCRKTFEVRINDRDYNVGDIVEFIVYDDKRLCEVFHELNNVQFQITYILGSFYPFLDKRYVVFSIIPFKKKNRKYIK